MRLFTVHVAIHFDYAAMAEDESSAGDFVEEVLTNEDHARKAVIQTIAAADTQYKLPDGWTEKTLVYGTDTDVSWAQARVYDELSTPVERLDFDGPPPTISILAGSDAGQWGWVGSRGSGTGYGSKAAAISAGWARYQTFHDPPGLEVYEEGGSWLIHVHGCVEAIDGGASFAEAMGKAWKWYEARLNFESEEGALLEDHDGAPVPAAPVWPWCLSWSNEVVAAVERWRWSGQVEMPLVLRRRRMSDGSTEIAEDT